MCGDMGTTKLAAVLARLGAMVLVLGSLGVQAAEWFVSPAGRDTQAGSRQQPFASIAHALAQAHPGDAVVLLPGVYYEVVDFTGTGTAEQPLTLKADKPRSVIITGADRDIREKKKIWKLADAALDLYEVDYSLPQPSRMLYDHVDLYPYCSLEELKTFTAKRGQQRLAAPKHGFAWDQQAKKLFVRLRQDGRYGSTNPNDHVMAVSPAPTKDLGPCYDLAAEQTRACLLRLRKPAGAPMYMTVEGIDFETPGRAAIAMMASRVTVRNCRFIGCWRGGVERVGNAEHITVEGCEWHCFPIFDDVREILRESTADNKTEIAWPHKARFRGARVPYETGICTKVGRYWTIRDNHIHDCFDALCNVGYSGRHVKILDNHFQRCLDNAVEVEEHGEDILIAGNRFEDVFQAVSWQPIDGPPWPGPVYVLNNLFYRTPAYADTWERGMAVFKIGAPIYQWELKHLKDRFVDEYENPARITAPGGFWICNNTFWDPRGVLINELNWSRQRLDGIYFYNNVGVLGRLRQYPDCWTSGIGVHATYVNNRFAWEIQKPTHAVLDSQTLEKQALTGLRLPSVTVPELPFRLPGQIGAEQGRR